MQDSQAMDDLWSPVPREAMPLMQPVDFFAALEPPQLTDIWDFSAAHHPADPAVHFAG